MLQAIVFDFDGVIADSEPLHLRAYQRILDREGVRLTRQEYYAKYLGFDDVGLFRTLAKDRGMTVSESRIDDWIAEKASIIEELLAEGSVLFPGAAECIRSLSSNYPLAIASGALAPEIELVLDRTGLSTCFTTIASASDNVPGKPAPHLYLLAVAKLRRAVQIDASGCAAIEDSHWGLESAKAAGLRTVAVTHTYPAASLMMADLVVNGLGEITIPALQGLWTSVP
jgi:beta-phosphoglucomutase